MSDPRKTGVSPITGKTVVVRHASTSDFARVEDYLKKHDSEGCLRDTEVVVAAEAERIIGFGILKKENDAGCVSVFEDSRRKGIGSSIVRHLLRDAAPRRVYAARSVSYFTHYEFAREGARRAARSARRRNAVMPLWEPLPIAVYEKP
ncbi:MAG TPA: GNAT family N-acetyltransferase [Nitrospirota bacterium]